MSRWLDRPEYVAGLAFIAGAAIAAVVVLIIVFAIDGDGDDDGDEQQAAGTLTPDATADAFATLVFDATPLPGAPTATPGGPTDPDDALEAYIDDELGQPYIGACSDYPDPDTIPAGLCSTELYRSLELVTFTLGVPFGEGIGEAVITPNEDGSWSVNFIELGPLGETIEVGSEAVVFGAGSCLNFREEAGLSGEVIACRIDGTTGDVVEGPEVGAEHTWWRLEGLGWASEQFLMPVP